MTSIQDMLNSKVNLGSEFNVRMHGNSERTADGKIVTPSLGHRGQAGSDPAFPDNADHIVTITEIDNNKLRTKITRECTCGLVWTYKERSENVEHRNVFDIKS